MISWSALWRLVQLTLCGLAGLGLYGAIFLGKDKLIERTFSGLGAALCVAVVGYMISAGEAARLDDAYMRILWQLIKATLAGLVLLAGCVIVFRKRAGIVLLHGGIGLMMLSEVIVGTAAVETRLRLEEGASTNFVFDIRAVELAISQRLPDGEEGVTVIPDAFIRNNNDETISDDLLPFDVEVLRFMKNSRLSTPQEAEEENLATASVGLARQAVEVPASTGTDADSRVDTASAYVRLLDKSTGQPIDTYLTSMFVDPQPVEIDGKTYEVTLRHKRTYKPYTVTLIDASQTNYLGTSTPQDYASVIRLQDETRGIDREVRIWMNNPLRYAGETFYQSSFIAAGQLSEKDWTELQVVTNIGWMIPYVSCMIVAVGMVAHFGITLFRFLNRRKRAWSDISRMKPATEESLIRNRLLKPRGSLLDIAFPLVVVSLAALMISMFARTKPTPLNEMDLVAFGNLPVVDGGRVKPLDSLARNALLSITDKESYKVRTDEDELVEELERERRVARAEAQGTEIADADRRPLNATKPWSEVTYEKKSRSPIVWFLDAVTEADRNRFAEVFRVENLDVAQTLGVEPKPGLYRYSIDEFADQLGEVDKQVEAARQIDANDRTLYQIKLMEFSSHLQAFQRMSLAFRPPGDIPDLPTLQEIREQPLVAQQKAKAMRSFLQFRAKLADGYRLPLAIPTKVDVKEGEENIAAAVVGDTPDGWQDYGMAWSSAYINSQFGADPAPATIAFGNILAAYANNDVSEFNDAVKDYRTLLKSDPPENLDLSRVQFEANYNRFAPFNIASWVYIAVGVLAALGWLGWTRPLNRAAFWLMLLVFGLHTYAILARIYISGRPPITNLYTTAIFVGWAVVLFSIVLESIYKLGIGNVVAAVAGYTTLRIAHGLALEGDTFTVLQAVLDTQFWLATHVVCMNLGYATSLLAGLLGCLYILQGVATPKLTKETGRVLTTSLYGILCFAIFFSFVGTVLGGLWADDSWGRFWGWDPKENGALMIVLWNALILHARWGGLVKGRGTAVLAVLGNIVLAWSWFAVNELGVGLHAYAGQESKLFYLWIFWGTQLAIAGLGLLPKSAWWSHRANHVS